MKSHEFIKLTETSTVDGEVQDPGSQVWKLTSLSAEAARAKYGQDRVRVKSGGLRSGGDMVEVLVSLGGVKEDQTATNMKILNKEYTGRSLYSVERDIWDSVDNMFNSPDAEFPLDTDGLPLGSFRVTVEYIPEQS